MYRYLLFPAMLLVSCGGGLSRAEDDSSASLRSVKSVVATTSEVVVKSYAGLSTPEEEVNLAFKVSGQVLSIPVVTGEEVQAGVTLAQLDPRDLELTVAADKSTYEQARSSYERAKRLLSHEAISKQEAEAAESTFTRSQSAYENSRELLAQTSLQAPFRAIIERVYVQEYQRVQAGESVIRVVSPTTNQVAFTLPENALSAIKNPSTTFSVTFDNYPDESFDAEVLEFARSSSDASGFPVKLMISNPAPSRFYINSGLSCSVVMSSPQPDQGAVVLPLSSIYTPTKGGTYVWIIDSENRVKLHQVEVGAAVGAHSVIINSGVKNGDRVVSAGVYQLRDNQEVKIIK